MRPLYGLPFIYHVAAEAPQALCVHTVQWFLLKNIETLALYVHQEHRGRAQLIDCSRVDPRGAGYTKRACVKGVISPSIY